MNFLKLNNIFNLATQDSIQKLIDSLPYYVILVDAEHTILLANKAVNTQLEVNSKD